MRCSPHARAPAAARLGGAGLRGVELWSAGLAAVASVALLYVGKIAKDVPTHEQLNVAHEHLVVTNRRLVIQKEQLALETKQLAQKEDDDLWVPTLMQGKQLETR